MPNQNFSIIELSSLSKQLGLDEERSQNELLSRDKSFGISSELGKLDQVSLWLNSLGYKKNKLVYRILPLIGLLMGVLSAYGIFSYSGKSPINLILVLLFYCFLPLVFFLLSLLFFIPVKSISFFETASTLLNPIRFFKKAEGEQFTSKKNTQAYKWFSFYCGQLFSVMFFLGSILTFLVLLSVTDLAFGWSSTLDIHPQKVHKLTSLLSIPWKEYAPDATPSLELVENTRFFRFEKSPEDAGVYGHWWPFILLSMFFYGFLPRLFLLIISSVISKNRVKKAALSLSGVDSLLWRLNAKSPQIINSNPSKIDDAEALRIEIKKVEIKDFDYFVYWGIKKNDEMISSKHNGEKVFHLNFEDFENSEEELLNLISKRSFNEIAIFVKAWEIPTEDLFDFIRSIKSQLKIYLLAINKDEKDSEFNLFHQQLWARKVMSLEDANVEFVGAKETVGENIK